MILSGEAGAGLGCLSLLMTGDPRPGCREQGRLGRPQVGSSPSPPSTFIQELPRVERLLDEEARSALRLRRVAGCGRHTSVDQQW